MKKMLPLILLALMLSGCAGVTVGGSQMPPAPVSAAPSKDVLDLLIPPTATPSPSPSPSPSPAPVSKTPAPSAAAPAETPWVPPAASVQTAPQPEPALPETPQPEPSVSALPPESEPPAASPTADPALESPLPASPSPELPVASEPPVVEPSTPLTEPEVLPAEPSPSPTSEPVPLEAPSDEEVARAYRQAEEAYGWFGSSPLASSGPVIEIAGRPYQSVASPSFPTLDHLRAYLKSLFSDEIVDSLLPIGGVQYLDHDGKLYVLSDGGTQSAPAGAENRQIIREGEDRFLVKVTADLVDPESGAVIGAKIETFPYERVGEKWIFTSFNRA